MPACCYSLKNCRALAVVTSATWVVVRPRCWAIWGAMWGRKALSLRLPRFATGASYGVSVSSNRRSSPIAGNTSRSFEFLKVTMPLMPNQ